MEIGQVAIRASESRQIKLRNQRSISRVARVVQPSMTSVAMDAPEQPGDECQCQHRLRNNKGEHGTDITSTLTLSVL